jgi:hypothetical protein
MKKIILVFTLLTFLLTLVACGGTSKTADTPSTSNSLSAQEEILIGTFKLEDTDLAVDPDQATQLIPLWQTLQSLTSSGTAATEEINAVIAQIKGDMTSQQIQAITAMKLTQQDLTSIMNEKGLTINSSTASNTTDASSIQVSMGNSPAGGTGDPDAAIPGSTGDPSGTGSGQTVSQIQVTTSQTSTSQLQGSSSQASASLLSALVELLEKKVQS